MINNGPSDSTGGSVGDVWPTGLTFGSPVSGRTAVGSTVMCPFGALANGATVVGNEPGRRQRQMQSYDRPPVVNSISVIKEASVEGRATCFFITGGKGLADFSLVDDGSGTNIQTFSSLLPRTFTITAIVPTRWRLTTVACTFTNGLGTRRCPSGE